MDLNLWPTVYIAVIVLTRTYNESNQTKRYATVCTRILQSHSGTLSHPLTIVAFALKPQNNYCKINGRECAFFHVIGSGYTEAANTYFISKIYSTRWANFTIHEMPRQKYIYIYIYIGEARKRICSCGPVYVIVVTSGSLMIGPRQLAVSSVWRHWLRWTHHEQPQGDCVHTEHLQRTHELLTSCTSTCRRRLASTYN